MHRPARLRPLVAIGLALAVLATGCSGTSGPDPLASFSGATLTIQARDIAFDPIIATAPANVPLRVVLDNQDAGVPHDLHVFQGAVDFGRSGQVVGPGLGAIALPALAPGRYQFQCTIHENMLGTIIVQAGAQPGPSLAPGDSTEPSDATGPTDTPGPSDTSSPGGS